jgi:hypothetical protein
MMGWAVIPKCKILSPLHLSLLTSVVTGPFAIIDVYLDSLFLPPSP